MHKGRMLAAGHGLTAILPLQRLQAMGKNIHSTILDQKLMAKSLDHSRPRTGKAYPYASTRQNTRWARQLLRSLTLPEASTQGERLTKS